jgi:NTE family protein
MNWTELMRNRLDRNQVALENKDRNDRVVELEMDQWELKLPRGLQSGPRIQQMLDRLTARQVLDAGNDFDRLPIPFRAVATDLLTGKPYVFQQGSLSAAIRASIAAPGFLTPVDHEGRLLLDGAIANILPIDVALAEGADVVIAVDVSRPLKDRKEAIESLVDVLDQIAGFYGEAHKQSNLRLPAIVVRPVPDDFELLDFDRSPLLIEPGAAAIRAVLPQIFLQLEARSIARNVRPTTSLLDPATTDLAAFVSGDQPIVPRAVAVEGLGRLEESDVLSLIGARPGEATSIAAIDRDTTALLATGLFDAASYRFSAGGEGAERRPGLTFVVHERSPLQIGLSARYDQDYKLTGLIDLVGRDSFRPGSDLFMKIVAGGAESAEVGLIQKRLAGSRLSISPQLQFRSRRRSVYDSDVRLADYRDRRVGALVSARYPLGNLAEFELGYGWEHADIDRRGEGADDTAGNIAGVRAGASVDTLNDVDFPTGGLLGTVRFDAVAKKLGADFSFSRYSAKLRHYYTPLRGYTFSVTTNLGVLQGNAPFFERFHTGGAQSLSFASTPFPGLHRDEVASRRAGIAGASLRRLIGHFETGPLDDVYLNVEYRAGFFSNEASDSRRLADPLHGFALGLHLDIRLLGPVRFDVARTDRSGIRADFSIGATF